MSEDRERPRPERVRPAAEQERRRPPSGTLGAVTGTLGGDARLEGGCVWLDTGSGRYDVSWPEGYTAEADPVRLLRGGEVIAEAGDRLTVRGHVDRDAVTFRQIGPVLRATKVEVAAPEG